jgi:hypothetical protein
MFFFFNILSVWMRMVCGLVATESACASFSPWNLEWSLVNLVGWNYFFFGLAHALSKDGCHFFHYSGVWMRLLCGLVAIDSACASSSLWYYEWIWVSLVGSNLNFFSHHAPRAYCWARRRGVLVLRHSQPPPPNPAVELIFFDPKITTRVALLMPWARVDVFFFFILECGWGCYVDW